MADYNSDVQMPRVNGGHRIRLEPLSQAQGASGVRHRVTKRSSPRWMVGRSACTRPNRLTRKRAQRHHCWCAKAVEFCIHRALVPGWAAGRWAACRVRAHLGFPRYRGRWRELGRRYAQTAWCYGAGGNSVGCTALPEVPGGTRAVPGLRCLSDLESKRLSTDATASGRWNSATSKLDARRAALRRAPVTAGRAPARKGRGGHRRRASDEVALFCGMTPQEAMPRACAACRGAISFERSTTGTGCMSFPRASSARAPPRPLAEQIRPAASPPAAPRSLPREQGGTASRPGAGEAPAGSPAPGATGDTRLDGQAAADGTGGVLLESVTPTRGLEAPFCQADLKRRSPNLLLRRLPSPAAITILLSWCGQSRHAWAVPPLHRLTCLRRVFPD